MKTWFITGASAGLGRIMTERLLARGDRVAATARRPDSMDSLRADYGNSLEVYELDVTDTDAMRRQLQAAFALFGRIDVIVGNAGYGLFGAAEELSDDQIDRQIATNLTASIQLIRASVPLLRAQGGGRFMQVSSEGGQVTYPNFSLYHATKWGIEGFVDAVSKEVKPFGIDFILGEPGPTGTGFSSNLDRTEPMAVYDATPSGDIRRALASGEFIITGDAGKTVDAMIAACDAEQPPLRLALSSTAYVNISEALAARLEALEAQRETAFAADVSA